MFTAEQIEQLSSLAALPMIGMICFATSMATPFASGVAALYLSAGGEAMTAAEIRPHLAGITTDHGRAGRDHSSGWGLLDLKKIIGGPEEPAEVNGFRVIARGSGLEIQLV